MTEKKLFHKEDQIARHFSDLVQSDDHAGNPLLPELEDLLGHYTTLLRKFERVTRVSDKQQISLHQMTKIDGLTGVNNRKHLEFYLKLEWKRSIELNVPISVIMIDIDYFKIYNDTYGHQAGDDCLRQVAGILESSVKRSSDFVARYGGEEFVIVLGDCHQTFAKEMATTIQTALAAANIPHKGSLASDRVTLSMGLATENPSSDLTVEDLIRHADKALYASKAAGRNQFSLYADQC